MNIFHLQILDRYLLKQFIYHLLGVTVILLLIYIATRLARYLAQAAAGVLPSDVIYTLLGYSSLGALSILLPMATFFAVILALGRMQSDSELTVIAACGIPKRRIICNVLLFSSLVAIVIGSLTVYIVPDMLSKRYTIEQKAKLTAATAGLTAGEFKKSQQGKWTFYFKNISNDNEMQDVFIEIHRGEIPIIFRAKYGTLVISEDSANKYLLLKDGYRYEGELGQKNYRIIQFVKHRLLIEKGQAQQLHLKHKSLSSAYLWQRGEIKDLAELQWRISTVVMTVILCLYGVALADFRPRQGRYHRIIPAILIYLLYSNLLAVAKVWITKGSISLSLGVLGVHLMMMIILWLYLQREHLYQWWYSYYQGNING
ncbi:MAG TPA: LPS export ABC transporter permease LptF [Gammaproteobacteria bacterium]|nr:LPS export ABC transporter permease LptF [Gammaproteobacteria bacterium]